MKPIRLLVAGSLLLTTLQVISQSKVDSLQSIWENASLSDTTRLKALDLAIDLKKQTSRDSAILIYAARITLASQFKDSVEIVTGLWRQAIIYTQNFQYDSAITNYRIAQSILRSLPTQRRLLAGVTMNIGENYFWKYDYDSAHFYLDQAILICEEIAEKPFLLRGLNLKGILYKRADELKPAENYFKKTYQLANEIGDKGLEGSALSNLGQVFRSQELFDSARIAFQRAVSIFEEIAAKKFLALTYHHLGSLSLTEGNFDQTLDFFQKSLALSTELENDWAIAAIEIDIADLFLFQENTEQFLLHTQNGLARARKAGNLLAEASHLSALGKYYAAVKGNKDQALEYYHQSFELGQEANLGSNTAATATYIAEIHFSNGEDAQCREFIEKSLAIKPKHNASAQLLLGLLYKRQNQNALSNEAFSRALEGGFALNNLDKIQNAAHQLYQNYKEQGQTGKSLEMYELYIKMQDSLQNEENQRATIRFEFQEKALQDSLVFVQQQADTEVAYQSQLAQRNYLLFGGLGLGLLAFLFFRNRQQRTAREKQIELERQEAEAQRLAELDQVKTRLYTNITHEFRTPLTVIQGMAEKIQSQPDKWQDNGINMIQRNSKHLMRLVNQMLDLSKLESGKLQLQLIQGDIVPFLFYLVESFSSYAEIRGIELQIEASVDKLVMDYDPNRITDILSNLLSNALKFTPEGGKVSVRWTHQAPQLLLQVRDNGPGISAEQLPYIFDRFYQTDDSDTRPGDGAGIGLALTQELVQLMGGAIEVQSEVGKGSQFDVSLPVRQAAPLQEIKTIETASLSPLVVQPSEAVETIFASIENESLPQVLLIEDNPDVVSYLVSCLEANYRLEIARNGAEGIAKAQELVPDLIISDVMMPKKDGFEVCYALKNDLRTSHIPIVLLTARADVDSKLTGLRQGADAYLTKPFHEAELLVRVQNLLQVRKALQERYTQAVLPASPTSVLPELELAKEDAFITQVRELILNRIDDYGLDVTALTEALHLSRTPLHNKLKALTGMSTTEFVRFVRLQKAQELLRKPDLNISEVAYQTGFQNPTYFSRKFKEVVGMTPKEWREKTES